MNCPLLKIVIVYSQAYLLKNGALLKMESNQVFLKSLEQKLYVKIHWCTMPLVNICNAL